MASFFQDIKLVYTAILLFLSTSVLSHAQIIEQIPLDPNSMDEQNIQTNSGDTLILEKNKTEKTSNVLSDNEEDNRTKDEIDPLVKEILNELDLYETDNPETNEKRKDDKINTWIEEIIPSDEKTINTDSNTIKKDFVVLGALDKITGRISTIELQVGEVGKFYSLEIMARSCQVNPPEKLPEEAAFLEIREVKKFGEIPRHLFTGWMFSSSPAVSAMDHPVYDVWVKKCMNKKIQEENQNNENSNPEDIKKPEAAETNN